MYNGIQCHDSLASLQNGTIAFFVGGVVALQSAEGVCTGVVSVCVFVSVATVPPGRASRQPPG